MKYTVNTESFGELFHTALRKLCETKPTSLLYNIIRIVPNETWVAFIAALVPRITEKGPFIESGHFAAVVGTEWRRLDAPKGESTSAWYALADAGSFLSLEDWRNATGYLWDMEKVEIPD